jgi:hypothetical protein
MGVSGWQLRTGEKVLMDQNSAISLSFVAKMRTNGQMKADGVPVNRKRLNEIFDSLIRIIGKKKLQSVPD